MLGVEKTKTEPTKLPLLVLLALRFCSRQKLVKLLQAVPKICQPWWLDKETSAHASRGRCHRGIATRCIWSSPLWTFTRPVPYLFALVASGPRFDFRQGMSGALSCHPWFVIATPSSACLQLTAMFQVAATFALAKARVALHAAKGLSIALAFALLAFALATLRQPLLGLIVDLFQVAPDGVKSFHLVHDHGNLLHEGHLNLVLVVDVQQVLEEVGVLIVNGRIGLVLIVPIIIIFIVSIFAIAAPPVAWTAPASRCWLPIVSIIQLVSKDLLDGPFDLLVVDGAICHHLQALSLFLGERPLSKDQVAKKMPSSSSCK